MPSGFQVDGVDLDDVFDPLGSATPTSNVGMQVGGIDISQRYFPLSDGGTPVSTVTNYQVNGADLNTIFGKAGSAGLFFRFLNQGSTVPFSGTLPTDVPTSFTAVVPFPSVVLATFDSSFTPTGIWVYPGGSWIVNGSAGVQVSYVDEITIPSDSENDIDTLWQEDFNKDGTAIPTVGQGIVSGTATESYGNATANGTVTVANTSMAEFIQTVIGAAFIEVEAITSEGATPVFFEAGPIQENDLWTGVTAGFVAAGLYSGTNQVMMAPVAQLCDFSGMFAAPTEGTVAGTCEAFGGGISTHDMALGLESAGISNLSAQQLGGPSDGQFCFAFCFNIPTCIIERVT